MCSYIFVTFFRIYSRKRLKNQDNHFMDVFKLLTDTVCSAAGYCLTIMTGLDPARGAIISQIYCISSLLNKLGSAGPYIFSIIKINYSEGGKVFKKTAFLFSVSKLVYGALVWTNLDFQPKVRFVF